MKNIIRHRWFTKGLVALAIVGIAGASGLVYAAPDSDANQTSGYGIAPETATDAINRLNDDFQSASEDFRTDVRTLVAAYKDAGVNGNDEADAFQTGFATANAELDADMEAARNTFLSRIQEAASTAESKDEFIDAYNNAKAAYFNELDRYKNEFAAAVSNLGHDTNVAKDQFMNGFNRSRDDYGNELEVIKNQFADTISNAPASTDATRD